jgi:predicted dehydrogenase
MSENPVRIGLFGVGHFGRLHLVNLLQSPFKLTGIYDRDQERAKAVAREFGVPWYDSPESLMLAIDAADIVVPTSNHMEFAELAIRHGKHMFIEKPMVSFAQEGRVLLEKLSSSDLKVQVGQIERFNPAFREAVPFCNNPFYIRSSRLAPYNPRANDVSVIHDLMIHDLDAVLSLVGAEIKEVRATGKSLLTGKMDLCEARVEFINGCIADFFSSRMHHEQVRLTEVFSAGQNVFVDYLNKEMKVIALYPVSEVDAEKMDNAWTTPRGTFFPQTIERKFPPSNAILEELNEFYSSITDDKPTKVDQHDAFRALFLADRIEEIASGYL